MSGVDRRSVLAGSAAIAVLALTNPSAARAAPPPTWRDRGVSIRARQNGDGFREAAIDAGTTEMGVRRERWRFSVGARPTR
jgi:hypothetical protein